MDDHGGGGGLGALWNDLEQLGAGLALADRDEAVAALTVAADADVAMADRLHGSVGREVVIGCLGGQRVAGILERVGGDFVLVRGGSAAWLVRTDAITGIEGLGPRALPETARPAPARLGTGSVLRRLAERDQAHAFTLIDGTLLEGGVQRVGADLVDVMPGERRGGGVSVPFGAIATIRLAR